MDVALVTSFALADGILRAHFVHVWYLRSYTLVFIDSTTIWTLREHAVVVTQACLGNATNALSAEQWAHTCHYFLREHYWCCLDDFVCFGGQRFQASNIVLLFVMQACLRSFNLTLAAFTHTQTFTAPHGPRRDRKNTAIVTCTVKLSAFHVLHVFSDIMSPFCACIRYVDWFFAKRGSTPRMSDCCPKGFNTLSVIFC